MCGNVPERREEATSLVEDITSIANEEGCAKGWAAHLVSVVNSKAGTLTAGTNTIEQMKDLMKESRDNKDLVTRQQHAEAEIAKAESEATEMGRREETERCTALQSLKVKTAEGRSAQAAKTGLSEADMIRRERH